MFGAGKIRNVQREAKTATLEDGLAYLSGQIEDLARLERRLARLESSVCGDGVKPVDDVPAARDGSLAGAAPRLMSYVFALAALSTKLHARADHLERTVGRPTALPAADPSANAEPAAAATVAAADAGGKGPRWEPSVAVSNPG